MEKKRTEGAGRELDLLDVVAAILEHWKILVVVTILSAAAFYGVSRYVMTPIYE